MPAGEAFSARQSDDITRAIRLAREESGLLYSVYVGVLEGDTRATAEAQHASLGSRAAETVLIAVDPAARRLEVVTGAVAKKSLDDRSCALAALTMTSQFGMGDLSGGIVNGLRTLAEHARHPRTLHLDNP